MSRHHTKVSPPSALDIEESRGVYRSRLWSEGAERLSDAELLAAVLHRGCAMNSAIGLAHELLQRFDGIDGLLKANRAAILAVPGMGPARWSLLQATRELFWRSLLVDIKRGCLMGSSAAVRDFLVTWLRDKPAEVFVILFLDNQNRLIAAEEVFGGTISQTAVYPREVVRRCIELNASADIFSHQHPSGLAAYRKYKRPQRNPAPPLNARARRD